MRIPVEVIVDGVVDAAAVFAAKAKVQSGDPVMLQEGAVVGARAERANPQVRSRTGFLPFGRVVGAADLPEPSALPDRELGLRVLDVSRHFIDESFQRVRAFGAKVAAAV